MKKEKTKVYIYTRVSTAMQIDGYSLDAQKSKMKAFAEQQGLSIPIDDVSRHHEIYLSDPRKTAADKLKTVIRYPVK